MLVMTQQVKMIENVVHTKNTKSMNVIRIRTYISKVMMTVLLLQDRKVMTRKAPLNTIHVNIIVALIKEIKKTTRNVTKRRVEVQT